MTEARDRWGSPAGVAALVAVIGLFGGALFWAGSFYGTGESSSTTTASKFTDIDKRFVAVDHRLEQVTTNMASQSGADRTYTDLAVERSDKDEQRDIRELTDKINGLQKGQDAENVSLGSIKETLTGVQADIKYAIGQRARGDR